ncbi:MAG: phosphatidate cytidylyltransferase [Nitrospinae bacterium]|nr:phosphatidate cytidylyltransferase [Nitrospinota bacterium]
MTRIITAAILAPLFIYVTISAPANIFTAMIELAAAICFLEYARMALQKGIAIHRIRGLVASLVIPLAFISSHYVAYMALALILVAFLFTALEDAANDINPAVYTIFGVIYIGVAFSAPVLIRMEENGPMQFLLICFATWGADIGAYYVGRSMGKTKLAPAISPGKTVEGVVGGIVSAVIFAGLFALIFFSQANVVLIAGAGLIGGIIGPVGDLAESQIKRHFGVKDSGSILPGHGGLLDRADALMLTAPAYYIFLALAGYIS